MRQIVQRVVLFSLRAWCFIKHCSWVQPNLLWLSLWGLAQVLPSHRWLVPSSQASSYRKILAELPWSALSTPSSLAQPKDHCEWRTTHTDTESWGIWVNPQGDPLTTVSDSLGVENRRPVQSSLPSSLLAAASFISHLHEPWILLKKEVWELLSAEVPPRDCCGYPQHAMCAWKGEATQREGGCALQGGSNSQCHTGKSWAILWTSWALCWHLCLRTLWSSPRHAQPTPWHTTVPVPCRGLCHPQKGPPDPPLQTPLLSPLITMRRLFHEELNPSSCYLFQFSHRGKLLPVNIAKMSFPHMRNMKEDELPWSDLIVHCLSPLPFSPSI